MTTANSVRSTAPAERLSGDALGAAGRPTPRKGLWVAAYCLAAVVPLAAVLVSSPPPGRGLVVELASALGILALTLLALQMALPARLGVVARPLGAEVAIRLHRHMADVLVAAVAATWRWSWSATPRTWRSSTRSGHPGARRRRWPPAWRLGR